MSDQDAGTVELRRLTKVYEGQSDGSPAVDGIDLTMRAGEFLTLLGPSGCGKTTTLRMVAGFEMPTSGTIMLDGRDMVRLPPNRRPMAMVFQNYALFPHLSVYENVAYGLRIDRSRRANLDDSVSVALTSMNLDGLAKRQPDQLSGGQQQRVALARALVMQPRVLLFDEPLSNLDAKLREQMRREIRLLQRRMGITSLYVTHDQDEAMSLSDRIVVMNSGRIEQVGTPGEIYTRPASVFVADFIGRASFVTVEPLGDGGAGDEGRVRVSAFDEELLVAAHPEVRHQQASVLMLRPESVTLTAVGSGANGSVVSAMYLGASVEYEVETRYGGMLISVSNPDPDQVLAEGTSVRVVVDPRKAYVLPRDESRARYGPEPLDMVTR